MTVLVTGGTGVLGRAVVERLAGEGYAVRVMSRRPAPEPDRPLRSRVVADLVTGEGVDRAVSGSDVVVHCATTGSARAEVAATAAVVEAARRADVSHVVYVSIVGVDRVPLGYYRGKLAAERVVDQGSTGSTVLRATQFHDLLRVLLAAVARPPVMPVPDVAFQPVAVADVAARIVELVGGRPLGRVPDLGGPEVRSAAELAHAYLAATGRRRRVVPVRLPGATLRAYRDGAHLARDRAVGTVTFERFLAEHPAPDRLSYRTAR